MIKKKTTKKKVAEKEAPDFLKSVDNQDLQITSVTRSYYRKLNLSIHGGAQFETLDIGESLTAEVKDDQIPADVSTALYELARKHVEDDILEYDKIMSGQEPKEPIKKKQKTIKDEIGLDADEIEEIIDLKKRIALASTKEELTEIGKDIKEKEGLSKEQLEYLRESFNSRAKVISDGSTNKKSKTK